MTADGTAREVDTIIFATGFSPTDPPIARKLRGADGRTMSEHWNGSPQAYVGTAVAGFPNLFMLYGPFAYITSRRKWAAGSVRSGQVGTNP